jgi:hypothetical protein
MSKYFSINGFWKEDKVKFSDHIVSEIDDEPQAGDPFTDEQIFFHGLTEDEIKQAIIDKWGFEEDFVITSYKEIILSDSTEYQIIQKARQLMKNDFMQFPDYDPHVRTYLADALMILLTEQLEEIPQDKVYDFFDAKLNNSVTPELKRAFDHVKIFFPTLSMVVIDSYGKWCYMDVDFKAFDFSDVDLDVSILEDGADSIKNTPFTYQELEQEED